MLLQILNGKIGIIKWLIEEFRRIVKPELED